MTVDERLDRVEHFTAALAEERRKDREEYRALWRDTQRQFSEVAVRINDLTVRMSDLTLKVAETQDSIVSLRDEMRAADLKLGERVDNLVSAIGQYIAEM